MKARRSVDRRGFTILEVLIATAIIGIGLVAMMAMQVAFISGTTTARDMTIGTSVGEMIVERLKTEGTMWTNISGPLTAESNPTLFEGAMIRPNQYVLLFGGFPVNHEGLPRDPAAPVANQAMVRLKSSVNGKYCADVRMQFMANTNNEVIVGQVRVAWPTDNEAPWLGAPVNQPVRCVTGGQGLNNVIYRNGDMNQPKPEMNLVNIPFSIKRHNL